MSASCDKPFSHTPTPPAAVIAAFDLDPGSLEPAPTGLINRTWFAETRGGGRCVLQRVNEIFPPAVQTDIDVVTKHLQLKGVTTPLLVATLAGALWFDEDGATWRALTFIDGVTYDSIEREEQAFEAGLVLARFHRSLSDLEHSFSAARTFSHDTRAHLAALEQSLTAHAGHRDYAEIERLASEVFELARGIDEWPAMPARIVHGDPKISNVLFDRAGTSAVCLIDLDTVTRMPVAFELGDALRSWANPELEDAAGAYFSTRLCAAALAGYARGSLNLLGEREWRAVAAAPYCITVELAARFCKDALSESYFGFDSARYETASEHNRARTRGQLALARSLAAERKTLQAIVERSFGNR